VLEAVETDDLQQLVDLALHLGLGPLADGQAEGDVVPHGHVLERGVVLEDEADAPALRRLSSDVDSGDGDGATVESLQPGDGSQQGRLTGPAGAEERREGARGDLEPDTVQGHEVPVVLAGCGDGDHRALLLRSRSVMRRSVATARPIRRVAAA
jgi:hypothetical protein